MKERNMIGIVGNNYRSRDRVSASPKNVSNALGIGTVLVGLACAPSIPQDAPPLFVELQFDPSAEPAKIFEPTFLVMDPDTGLIDFSVAGFDVPGVPKDSSQPVDPIACQNQQQISVAQCEFYQYLERLDGFPTLTPGLTPAGKPLDLTTVTLPQNLFIYDINRAKTITDVTVSFDTESGALIFDPKQGWDIDGLFVIGIRGYQDGVKSDDGEEAVASIIYTLLKQERSLTCGAATAKKIDPTCDFYNLFSSDPSFSDLPGKKMYQAIGETLVELEHLRQVYNGETDDFPDNLWDILEDEGNMPKEEVAIAWFFETHKASVVELDPTRDMVPRIVSSNEIRLKVKGTLNPDTLRPYSLQQSDGTVFLFNGDKLQVNPFDPAAIPPFTLTYEDGDIVFTTTDPDGRLIEGDTYVIILTNEITDQRDRPLLPSPVTVLLRTRGALVDEKGHSQVSGVSDADAKDLEEGRLQFVELLDDPLMIDFTKSETRPNGLTREIVTYLYGFPFTLK